MVIYVKPDGTTVVSNDSIGLGSHISRVNIVAATRPGAFVELLVMLPSGLAVPAQVCAPVADLSAESVGVYTCTLNKSITSQAGSVKYQIRFTYPDGQIEMTPGGSFAVQAGIIVIPPGDASEDVYDEIKSMLSAVNANYSEVIEKFDEFQEKNEQTVAQLNQAVKETGINALTAQSSASTSIQQAAEAQKSAEEASASKTEANAHKEAAKASENLATAAAERADQASARANRSASDASASQADALSSKEAAKKYVDEARELLSQLPKFSTHVVDQLPVSGISATAFYLIKSKNNGADIYTEYLFIPYDLVNKKKEYTVSEGTWEKVGVQSSDKINTAPSFDLNAEGLPATPMTGETVSHAINTESIFEAASSGPIKLILVVGNTLVSFIASGIKYGEAYLFVQKIDTNTTLFIRMTSNAVASKISIMPVIPSASGFNDGNVMTVVDGEWQAAVQTLSEKDEKRIAAVEKKLDDLMYNEISVSSFTNSVGFAEIGSTVNSVTLTWKLNKTPKSVTLDDVAQSASTEGSVTKTSLGLKANKTWTLKATDDRDATATKTTSVSFVNGVYYGVAAAGAMNSAFILGLTRVLRSNKLPSFTVNASSDQYIYYCVPTRYGTCSFSVGGFSGGFTLATTTEFTNASGYTEQYYVYKSDNAGLGNTTVNVT